MPHFPSLRRLPLCLVGSIFAIVSPLKAAESQPTAGPPPPPPFARVAPGGFPPLPLIEKAGPGLLKIGTIMISRKERSISFPAAVNMQQGLLEYLVVHEKGKIHESLLRTPVSPQHLQFALLLVGLEGAAHPLARQGSPEKPEGDAVTITVSGKTADGKGFRFPIEQWVLKKAVEYAPAEKLDLVFTGSVMHQNRFMAEVEGSIAALYHDPAALLDNASPGGESDRIWFVNKKEVPPIGTAVTVTITAH